MRRYLALFGLIGFVTGFGGQEVANPTYRKDIGPLLARSCVPCHRPGAVAPFSLRTYEEVMKRKELLQIVMLPKKMPPCDATSDFGPICNEPRPTDRDLRTLQEWVRRGYPEGSGPKPAPYRPVKWRLGSPDVQVRIPGKIETKPEGNPYWIVHRVPIPPTRGLRAFDIIPDAPKAVRQIVVAKAVGARNMWNTYGSMDVSGEALVGAWSPGFRAFDVTPSQIDLSGVDALWVQVLVVPTGKVESGNLTIGLYKGRSGKVWWKTLDEPKFEIGSDRQRTIEKEWLLEQPTTLLGVHPEARYFARQIRLRAVLPNGTERILLFVLNWDMLWLGNYLFAKPARLPAGTRILAAIDYDNGRHAALNEQYFLKRQPPPVLKSGSGLRDEVYRVHFLVAEGR